MLEYILKKIIRHYYCKRMPDGNKFLKWLLWFPFYWEIKWSKDRITMKDLEV